MVDLPKAVQERLYFLRFEDLMAKPAACMSHVYSWLGVAPFQIDPEKIAARTVESDSHYHMKYPHKHSPRLAPPVRHEIPARIQTQIEAVWAWFYQLYYPAADSSKPRA